jgi:hypothetical protein
MRFELLTNKDCVHLGICFQRDAGKADAGSRIYKILWMEFKIKVRFAKDLSRCEKPAPKESSCGTYKKERRRIFK